MIARPKVHAAAMLVPVLAVSLLLPSRIAVAGTVPGGVTCDGSAEVDDVVVAIFAESPCPEADVNEDGRTSSADLTAVVKSPDHAVPTATATGVVSPTATFPPTAFPSPTATDMPTATRTVTRTGTLPPSPTPTWTLPPTRTPTLTPVNTATRTPSRTRTPSNTIPPTRTRTPSNTIPPSRTRTATRTPTGVFTATATATRTATPPVTPTSPPQEEGPLVRFFGVVRSNGCFACNDPQCVCGTTPTPTPFLDNQGRPIYRVGVSSGFLLVVEAQPGSSGSRVGDFVPAPIPDSPLSPDLQMQSNRNLGNGSTEICDMEPPSAGGIPGINPPDFDPPPGPANDALTDFACRFEALNRGDPCTLNSNGGPGAVSPSLPNGSKQFCYLVSTATSFAFGDTVLSVRVRDEDGNLGAVQQIVVRRQ